MWALAGSESRTLELYRLLRPHADVKIWSAHDPDPRLSALAPIQRIRPWRLQFPRGGTLVFVGVYYKYGSWVDLSGARRRVIVYNSPHHHVLRRKVRRLSRLGRRVEVVFASRWLQEESGYQGPVQVSPVDLLRFTPPAGPPPPRPFTVGRLSRNQPEKHNLRDPALYDALVAEGMAVRVMGGEVLRSFGPVDGRVHLLPEGTEDAVTFLHGLDAFFYRTADDWNEPHGRVTQEAMACGLPVICGRHGGMKEYIQHGQNGFVVDDEAEALAILRQLRDDPALRARVGVEARRTMERLFSPASFRELIEFYVGRPLETAGPAAAQERVG